MGTPELLLLAPLFVTLTLIGHYFAHRIKRSLEVFHYPPLRKLSRIVAKKGLRRSPWRSISLALKLVIIVLITFTLAHPTLVALSETSQKVEVPMVSEKDVFSQIVLVVDVSPSMGLKDVYPSRLEVAKSTLVEFVQNASEGVRFAVVPFESRIRNTFTITGNRNRIVKAIENLTVSESLACLEEATDIGYGLQAAVDFLTPYGSSNKSSAVLLVSDGFANYGFPSPFASVSQATARASSIGITINALHIARMGQDSNDELMRQIASETGGKFMDSMSVEELRDVLNVMGKYYVPTHEWSSTVEVKTAIPVRTDIGFVLMFIAVAFVLVLWVGNYRHYKTAF